MSDVKPDVYEKIDGLELETIEPRLVITAYTRDITFTYKGVEYFGELRYDPNNGYEFGLFDDNEYHPDFLTIEDFWERLDNMCIAQAKEEGIEDVHDS